MELKSRDECRQNEPGGMFWKMYDALTQDQQRAFLRFMVESVPAGKREKFWKSVMDSRNKR